MQYVYLIRCSTGPAFDYHKIGVATDVYSRLAQLQTGNPLQLEVLDCFGFENAEIVERVLHQKYAEYRLRGEWFQIPSIQAIEEFSEVCTILGGVRGTDWDETASEEEVAEAEEVAESPAEGAKWDFAQMYADGWRIERTNGRGIKNRYWCWRRGGSEIGREYIYGGMIEKLPHELDKMREIYGSRKD